MESNTRQWWRSRIVAITLKALIPTEPESISDGVEEWLDDLMQTPELSFAEFAESKPEYRLAVVDFSIDGVAFADDRIWYRVVKMEEKHEENSTHTQEANQPGQQETGREEPQTA